MTDIADDEMTELVDADFPRVDLVGKGANGIPRFLIAKQDEGARGLVPPDMVRDLIGKQAGPQGAGRERVTMPSGVTLSGSPADIAAFIHKAAQRAGQRDADDVAKEKNDTADRKHKAATGAAMPDGSYPIGSVGDLAKAIRAVGRGGSSHDAIRKHIITRARSLGASSEIPGNWNSDGSLKGDSVSKSDQVAKDIGMDDLDLDDGIDGMDPTVPLAAPDEDAPGDPTDPGSPAWEAIDAATACKWTSILARARVAVDLLSEREMLEAASADPDDAEHACDLATVCDAIDYAIGILAPYAVAEQSEADCGTAEMEAIGKAAAGLGEPVAAIEGLAAVAKAGRVLSAANEAHIREAAQALNTVLSSLPKAPVTDDGQPVAKSKETTVDATQTAPETAPGAETVAKETAAPETPAEAAREVLKGSLAGIYDQYGKLTGVTDPAAIVQRIAKADGGSEGKTTMQAVFDEDGNLVGIVDPADITPVAGAGPKADSADTEPAPAADASDMTPQPPADAGTPADAAEDDGTVTKSEDASVLTALESIIAKAVSSALGAQAPQEDVAKQAHVAGLEQKVEELLSRVAKVEEMPAAPGVFTHGATPPSGSVPPSRPVLRGQDQGASAVNVAKAAELRRQFREADPAEQNRLAGEMQQAAIGHLAALHGRA